MPARVRSGRETSAECDLSGIAITVYLKHLIREAGSSPHKERQLASWRGDRDQRSVRRHGLELTQLARWCMKRESRGCWCHPVQANLARLHDLGDLSHGIEPERISLLNLESACGA